MIFFAQKRKDASERHSKAQSAQSLPQKGEQAFAHAPSVIVKKPSFSHSAKTSAPQDTLPNGSSSKKLRPKHLPLNRRMRTQKKKSIFLRFLGSWLLLGFLGSLSFIGLTEGGHIQRFRDQNGSIHDAMARKLGLGFEHITISGINQLHVSEILTAAQISPKGSLPSLNVSEAKTRLERLPLIKNASLRKLYPDGIVITLEERNPYAIWQKNGELYIIAKDGTTIDLMQDSRFLRLPFVVGDYANKRTNEYLTLLEAAGSLKPRIIAGTLVAGRRWTLKMDNGIDVRLPEFEALAAVKQLVKLEASQKILEKDILAIDLRMPDRVVLRLSEEAAIARAATQKNKITKGRGVQT